LAPVMQLIVIPLAADFEVKNINLTVMDNDKSSYSQKLVNKMLASGYFRLTQSTENKATAQKDLEKGTSDIVLEIPVGFENTLVRENNAHVFMNADAVNIVKAGLGLNYGAQIIQAANQEIRADFVQPSRANNLPTVDINTQFWYNPSFNYRRYMAPGILALLLIMVGAMMSALNIVREKEIGTMEQINVTPVKSYQFLLAKLIPFWVIGMISLTIGLTVCYFAFGIWSVGSYFTVYAFAAVYLVAALGIGQIMAVFSDTQLQATLFAFFFMMLFVLLSGLYTSVESMPFWAQKLAWSSPVTHFVAVMRSVLLKGSSFYDLREHFYALCVGAIVFNAIAIFNFRKTVA
jgi:ABC-2 type transport system permease protein